jgi:hypothetical protein
MNPVHRLQERPQRPSNPEESVLILVDHPALANLLQAVNKWRTKS